MQDENTQSSTQPNQQRRRFAKAGLATPVVLATLISKPVLGANFSYHCTVSGKLSGNTSAPHGDGSCGITGVKTADTWKTLTPVGNWPAGSLNNQNNGPRLFRTSPSSGTPKFSNVYKKPNNSDATLLDVLNGNLLGGSPNPLLGKEAVAALLNALSLGAPANFPIAATEVTRLFNGVIGGGTVQATSTSPGSMWGASEVLKYFQCINGSATCDTKIPAV